MDGATHKPVVILDGRDGQIFTIIKTDFNLGLQGEATKTEALRIRLNLDIINGYYSTVFIAEKCESSSNQT